MMSAALDPVTQLEHWSVWILTTGLTASAEMYTLESSARPMWMTVTPHPAEMVENVRTWLETMNVDVLKAGLARTVRRMRRAAVRPLVRTMLFVWTSSKTSSVPAHLELMVRSVRPHPRDALETPA